MQAIKMVDNDTLCSMRQLADYVIENKIEVLFVDAITVRKWLDIESVEFGTCPRCKKESMEISGEGITSDGKHYPMEQCLYCGFIPVDFSEYSGTARANSEKSSERDIDEM
jgi:hypothetical protein